MVSQNRSQKIAVNTAVLYLRMFAILVINLIAVRLVLRSLGATDYGIYNVVAGIIAIVGFIGTAMASSTQRFYSYYIGQDDGKKQKEVYTASFVIFLVFSIVALLITEVAGLWLINNKLVIPANRIIAAKWVFHFSVLSFISTIMAIPFSAAIIANENMKAYAAITFGECLLKFFSALLLYLVTVDKLIVYGFAIMITSIIVLSASIIFATHKYKRICSFVRTSDKGLYKSLISFSGWSLFGSAAGVLINQGNTLLVNIFFGPIVNAARAIALQISNALVVFSGSFTTALRPPIVKSYAENNDDYVNKLFSFGNKFIYYAMLMVCVPLFFEMETVLTIWIKDYDTNTIVFSRLIIIYTLVMVLHDPITTIIQASGRINIYYLFSESFTILCMPATYIAYKLGASAYATFVIMCIAIVCSHVTRLFILKKQFPSFSFHLYVKGFVVPAFFITTIIVILSLVLCYCLQASFLRLLLSIILSVGGICSLAYYLALSASEKGIIREFFSSFAHKFKKN